MQLYIQFLCVVDLLFCGEVAKWLRRLFRIQVWRLSIWGNSRRFESCLRRLFWRLLRHGIKQQVRVLDCGRVHFCRAFFNLRLSPDIKSAQVRILSSSAYFADFGIKQQVRILHCGEFPVFSDPFFSLISFCHQSNVMGLSVDHALTEKAKQTPAKMSRTSYGDELRHAGNNKSGIN